MKKRGFPFLLLVFVCFLLAVPSFAEGSIPRLTDAAGLLSEEEASALLTRLDEASDRAQYDIVIITLTTLESESIENAAVQLFDTYQFGYGDTYDGTIFLISMAERDTRIESFGVGQYLLDDRACDVIFDLVIPSLSAGEYYDAFTLFADYTEEIVTEARSTGVWDDYWDNPAHYGEADYTPAKAPFNVGSSLFAGLLISLLIAAIVTGSMKGKLKSVRQQNAASGYIRQNSLNLTDTRERFLYRNVTRTPKAPPNERSSSHSSGGSRPSSGGHSGSSHKF